MLVRSTHIAALLALLVTAVQSSHFLGGTISWRIQNASTNSSMISILITQTYLWTYVAGRCDNGAIATNQPVSGSGGSITCSPSCPAGFAGLSTTPGCTDLSIYNGIAIGQRSDVVNIPEGSVFSMIYASSAWGTLTLGGSSWSIASRINLVRRADNNMFNNAPVATVMSPLNIEVNKRTLIPISVSDADGDNIRCRWAGVVNGVDECSSVCPPSALPANTTLHPNCTIEITGPVVTNKFAVALMVEDFVDSSSTTPLSSVPVQFLVKVIASPSCPIQPEIALTGPSCTPIKVNETFQASLLGMNYCGDNVTIIDIATLSFPGMLQGALTKINSQVYYKTLTWTPTIAQVGYQVMCAMALNSQYSQSPQHCFTFYVTEHGSSSCPGVSLNTTVVSAPTTTEMSTTTSTSTATTSTTSTSTSTTTTSVPKQQATPSCINAALIAGLAALAFAALACNLCLLCHVFRCCLCKQRRSTSRVKSSREPTPVANTPSFDEMNRTRSTDIDEFDRPPTPMQGAHEGADHRRQPFPYSPTNDQPHVAVTRIPRVDTEVESDPSLPRQKKPRHITHVQVRPHDIASAMTHADHSRQPKTNTGNVRPPHVVVEHVSKHNC